MDLNDLFQKQGINPKHVLVLRHAPEEAQLRKVLPWLAADKPDLFNAYQQTQTERVENAFQRVSYVASFIGHGGGKALFVGLYLVGQSRPLTREKFWRVPQYVELKKFGLAGLTDQSARSSILWFDLELVESFHASWKGKLIVGWPPPEVSWWRRADKNNFPIVALLEDSALVPAIPEWRKMVLTWQQLCILPILWRSALSEWRGIYYIFDASDGKGYVGSAYGDTNLLGRWQNYAASGHGGNALLRKRDPKNLRFGILERVSPDEKAADVIQLEGTWKERLHTRSPQGLNDN